jgi:hypothetical protein
MKHLSLYVAALIALMIVAGCAPASQAATSAASVSPAADSAANPAGHVAPTGATAPVDPASWALADRLTSATYTADTTAALIAGLARSGIATFGDPASPTPEQPLGADASPFEMLDFQAHALAVGAWAGSTWSGAELDGVLPIPPGITDAAPASVLLASYVAAVDSPGAALSRALMAGQDLLQPSTLRFPGVVLVLFVSDLATNGGHAAGPGPGASRAPSPIPSQAEIGGSAQLAMAGGHSRAGEPILPAIELGSVCSATTNWLEGMINRVFNALKLAESSNFFGAIFVTVWNYAVDRLQSLVQGVITTVTDAVLGSIRSVAAAISVAAEQVASILPYAVRVVASGGTAASAFLLDADPHQGVFTASVTAGDLPAWPAVLQDCATVAGIALPDFTAHNVPLTWGTIQAPGDPLLSPLDSATTAVTDAAGQATWGFVTSVDPGEPTGQRITQLDSLPVAIHRPELDQLRDKLTAALLGPIPAILRPFLAGLIAPAFDGLQARLNTLLDARGTGWAALTYHGQASPAPSRPASPAPSGACSPNPVAAGTYGGTVTSTSRESIDIGAANLVGNVLATSQGTGPAAIVIAADGSVSGSWSLRTELLFHEKVESSGAVVDDLRDEVYDSTGTSIGGAACDLKVGFGGISVVSCTDSLKGDCSNEPQPPGATQLVDFGPPSSITAGNFTWTWSYTETGGQPSITATFTLSVSRQ